MPGMNLWVRLRSDLPFKLFCHCLCLAILYPCLYNNARSSLCCAGEIRMALPILLFYSGTSRAKKVKLLVCAPMVKSSKTCQRAEF